MNKENFEIFLNEFQKTWLAEWTSDKLLSNALQSFIEQFQYDGVCVLPYVNAKKTKILWAVTATSIRDIRDYFEDAKAWLQFEDCKNLTGEIVQNKTPESEIALNIASISPQGYGRWVSPIERFRPILLRLAQMNRFLATKPDKTRVVIPTLPTLRLSFITALTVGDWGRAEACIDEIDRWNLEQASSTLHMRIRLFEAQGDTKKLFHLACQQEAWNFSSPSRIASAILNAVDHVSIMTEEENQGLHASFQLFKNHWYGKLYQLVEDAKDELKIARILAMAATSDKNHSRLKKWIPHISAELANLLVNEFPNFNTESNPVSNPSNVQSFEDRSSYTFQDNSKTANFWQSLHDSIKKGHSATTLKLLEKIDENFLNNTEFICAAPDGLLELLSDPDIDHIRVSHLLRQDAIAKLIDAFVGSSDFPRFDHLECYLSLLDGMVILNSDSMNSNESQLLLGLVGASVHLSSSAVSRCEQIVRQWWTNRPLVQRIDWLASSLDTLASVHSNPSSLVDLYIDGLDLASRRGQKFTVSQIRSWEAIGLALELSFEFVTESLLSLRSNDGQESPDPLAISGLKQVAIISLQETSAREAAREIERRSGATVNVVTSSVADFQARNAKTSDLILYVWAATSHATYRSLDSVRDRIEYVQGTGSSSILVAAERWVERSRKVTFN